MAFLINAYNAFTVEKILTRYPELRSIRDFGKLFGNPFKDEFFTLFGRRASLDWIEHEMLRKTYREPRVHFALNCASIGCPMLRAEAYVAARLEAQLEDRRGASSPTARATAIATAGSRYRRSSTGTRKTSSRATAYFARHAELLGADAAAVRAARDHLPRLRLGAQRLSIVVPALNEAAGIGAALAGARAAARARPRGDRGRRRQHAMPRAALAAPLCDRLLTAPRGRAAQMNAGARAALRATRCSSCMRTRGCRRMPTPGCCSAASIAAGAASTWRSKAAIRCSAVVAAAMNLRSRLTGIATGDQAIFVRREAFAGFPEIALMEDIAFSAAMKRRGRRLPARARAHIRPALGARGVLRTIVLMWRLRLLYRARRAPRTPRARLCRAALARRW